MAGTQGDRHPNQGIQEKVLGLGPMGLRDLAGAGLWGGEGDQSCN